MNIPLYIYNIKDAQYFKILSQSIGLGPKVENEELSFIYQLKKMNITDISDNRKLADNENLHPSIIGMVVDYLSRFMSGLYAETPNAMR